MNRSVINVVSPHRDDAAFSLGGTIARLVGLGHTVRVVNCFTVSRYAPRSASQVDAEAVDRLRTAEDNEFAGLLGGKLEVRDLGRLDAPIRLRCRVEDVRSGAPIGSAGDREAEAIRAALDRCAPGVLLLPLGIGLHIDHRVVLEAGVRAAIRGRCCGFYEDLPYAAEGRECCRGKAVIRASAKSGRPLTAALSGEFPAAEKRNLLACYRSQISEEQVGAILDYGERLGGERLWLTPEAARELSRAGIRFERSQAATVGQPWSERLRCLAHESAGRARTAVRRRLRVAFRGGEKYDAVHC